MEHTRIIPPKGGSGTAPPKATPPATQVGDSPHLIGMRLLRDIPITVAVQLPESIPVTNDSGGDVIGTAVNLRREGGYVVGDIHFHRAAEVRRTVEAQGVTRDGRHVITLYNDGSSTFEDVATPPPA
jgi:hypothetical protein